MASGTIYNICTNSITPKHGTAVGMGRVRSHTVEADSVDVGTYHEDNIELEEISIGSGPYVTPISYFSSQYMECNVTGAVPTTTEIPLKMTFVRIDNIVIFSIVRKWTYDIMYVAPFYSAETIPVAMRPGAEVKMPMRIMNTNAITWGMLTIPVAGEYAYKVKINVRDNENFNATDQVQGGWYPVTFAYSLDV